MKKYILIQFLWVLGLANVQASFQKSKPTNDKLDTEAIAKLVLKKGLSEIDLGLYPGSLLMQGMSELAATQKDASILNQTVGLFEDFKSKKIKGRGSLISYEAGGSGVAYLNFLKKTNLFSDHVLEYANKMYKNQKRTSEGLLTAPWLKDSLDQFMIDCAFPVTPYMLYSGLAFNKPEYLDLAVYQTVEMFRILKDPNGLIHQGRGFVGLKSISEDNWSRGNGWGALALATLVRDLPDSHPRKQEVNELAKSFFLAVLKYQNQQGLWNQEMTDHTSYIETSGSGLMLFGIGICIEKGVLAKSYLPQFIKGLSGYTSYISSDGSVSNTCSGCLCPGKGTKKDYIKKEWKLNDPHAFGPVVLVFTQASNMGIKEITLPKSMGCYVTDFGKPIKPQTYIRYMPEANGNILWENDRVAFRVYGSPVKDRVSSGIDVWTKSVDYPIIDKWYSLNAQGVEYHIDHGEGCDFFHVGFSRGDGGTAIWHDNKPYISKPYISHRILKNTEDEIAFELIFDPWQVGDFKVSEHKVITMKTRTNFFKVVSTFQTDSKQPLTVGIGIAYAKKPEIITDAKKGSLTIWESYMPENGELGTSIMINPADFKGFKDYEKEKFILVKATSGKPITYYVGAGWNKAPQFETKEDWLKYIESELPKLVFK
ncbi:MULTISPECIES: DUF4861 family protein [unclassified Arcicella]|uniref:DUF4861 family protein n=1 Tax=unclassified Arcicella TaxID=2644986 RepID=UPI0028542BDF|nr:MULTISPECIES: DUF4861 family protein [unclassified Arcicella]MDR6562281.1 rhamnogalacturonyl hydrolase YesR [Arcicella sp. BE51]MDR6812025.1 rhamnogalacturonyl hydrolase YesR [Arcicella sp. BE140]MDR6823336.1 rhamnogalacturonyl hydrolase YesR [Arcicella sp. BE139]